MPIWPFKGFPCVLGPFLQEEESWWAIRKHFMECLWCSTSWWHSTHTHIYLNTPTLYTYHIHHNTHTHSLFPILTKTWFGYFLYYHKRIGNISSGGEPKPCPRQPEVMSCPLQTSYMMSIFPFLLPKSYLHVSETFPFAGKRKRKWRKKHHAISV